MGVFLTRNFWMLPLAAVITCALLAASTVNHLIEAFFLVDAHAGTPLPARARRPPPPPRRPDKDADGLIARNMFCSTCEPGGPAPEAPRDDRPQGTSLPLVLVATTRAASGEHAATIADTSTGRFGSYRVGDTLASIGPVRHIGAQSVDVFNTRSARLERISLTQAPAPAVAAAAPAAAAAPEQPGIKRVADNRFEIDRSLVEQTLADPTAVTRGTRIAPVIENGRPMGFRVSGVKPGSLLGRMGLESGDQIQAVNGYEITTPDTAFEAYRKLRSASNLQLAVNRRGARVNLEYTIR